MLETLSILFEKQGRSQAAPLAAGVSPGRIRCRVRPVPLHRCRMLRVSYIPGTGTGRQGSAPYPASERPHPQNATNYPNHCYFTRFYFYKPTRINQNHNIAICANNCFKVPEQHPKMKALTRQTISVYNKYTAKASKIYCQVA